MQNQSFDDKKEQLINSYTSVPTKQTINMFIKFCFMNETANFEKYYRNLGELDREFAYFSLRKSKEDKEYYYSKFPDPNKDMLLTYDMFDMTPNKFDDITISNLSIEIFNFIYFEYFLFKQVKSFKDNFNFLIDEFLKTKTHQLISLENEFKELKNLQENFNVNELDFEGIDYPKLYDLIETSRKEIWQFIESKINHINANSKNLSSGRRYTREKDLLKIIDKANLDLFYEFEKWLITESYIDEINLNWINNGGKASFSRLYYKLDKLNLIKKGGGLKRNDKIRLLSNIYKIDGVSKFDYGIESCNKANKKDENEFSELSTIKSQHNHN
jgi:hypothetical protein